jgi:hypothetical protein
MVHRSLRYDHAGASPRDMRDPQSSDAAHAISRKADTPEISTALRRTRMISGKV